MEQVEKLHLSPADMEEATRSDPILQGVLLFKRDGWDVNGKQKGELAPYLERRHELSVEGNCLFWGERVVVPPVFQQQVLKELHDGHGAHEINGKNTCFVAWY